MKALSKKYGLSEETLKLIKQKKDNDDIKKAEQMAKTDRNSLIKQLCELWWDTICQVQQKLLTIQKTTVSVGELLALKCMTALKRFQLSYDKLLPEKLGGTDVRHLLKALCEFMPYYLKMTVIRKGGRSQHYLKVLKTNLDKNK